MSRIYTVPAPPFSKDPVPLKKLRSRERHSTAPLRNCRRSPSSYSRRQTTSVRHSSTPFEDVLLSEDMDSEKATGHIPAYKGKKAVVVGAGPAGSVAAAFLVEHGFDVKVFEQRADPAKLQATSNRDIPILLFQSSIETLKRVGAKLPENRDDYFGGFHLYEGTAITSLNQLLVITPPRELVLGPRIDVVNSVLDVLKQHHSEIFYFEHACKGASLAAQTVTFQTVQGEEVTEEYDLLVAADGANSVITKTLENYDKDFKVEVLKSISYYKSIRNLKIRDPKSIFGGYCKPGRLVFCTNRDKFDGKPCPDRIVMFLTAKGDVCFVLSGMAEESFENIRGREASWAEHTFPDFFPEEWKQELPEQMKDAPLSKHASVTSASKLIGKGVVLLGDAVHSVPPRLGNGCNMAIGDGSALNDALVEADGNIEAALKLFNAQRGQEIRDNLLLVQCLPGHFLETGKRNIWLRLVAWTNLSLFALGHKWFPSLVPRSAFGKFVIGQISAGEAMASIRRTGHVLIGLLAGGIYLLRGPLLSVVKILLTKFLK